jgi:hypothetical protein
MGRVRNVMGACRAIGVGALLLFILLAAACSKEDQQDLVGAVGRQAIVEGANGVFSDAGVEVDGEMDCAGDVQGDVLVCALHWHVE